MDIIIALVVVAAFIAVGFFIANKSTEKALNVLDKEPTKESLPAKAEKTSTPPKTTKKAPAKPKATAAKKPATRTTAAKKPAVATKTPRTKKATTK